MSAAKVRRRRTVAVAILLVATTAIVALVLRVPLRGPGDGPLAVTGSTGDLTMRPAVVHIHVVQPGETIWSIVQASGVRGDPRPIVDRLESEIDHRPLQVGQRLVLP
jgi:LysM domain